MCCAISIYPYLCLSHLFKDQSVCLIQVLALCRCICIHQPGESDVGPWDFKAMLPGFRPEEHGFHVSLAEMTGLQHFHREEKPIHNIHSGQSGFVALVCH